MYGIWTRPDLSGLNRRTANKEGARGWKSANEGVDITADSPGTQNTIKRWQKGSACGRAEGIHQCGFSIVLLHFLIRGFIEALRWEFIDFQTDGCSPFDFLDRKQQLITDLAAMARRHWKTAFPAKTGRKVQWRSLSAPLRNVRPGTPTSRAQRWASKFSSPFPEPTCLFLPIIRAIGHLIPMQVAVMGPTLWHHPADLSKPDFFIYKRTLR